MTCNPSHYFLCYVLFAVLFWGFCLFVFKVIKINAFYITSRLQADVYTYQSSAARSVKASVSAVSGFEKGNSSDVFINPVTDGLLSLQYSCALTEISSGKSRSTRNN